MSASDDQIKSGTKAESGSGSSYRPCVAIVDTRVGHSFTQDINVGGFTLIGDEPTVYGGDDLGPNPYEYLASALATCTNMTVQMYARRKGFSLERVRTIVRHDKVYAKDLEHPEDLTGKIDVLDCEVQLFGDLDDEARERIMSIAQRCPVHKTLTSDIRVRTREVSD